MKIKIMILALLVTAGMAGNVFALATGEGHYPTASSSAPWYIGQQYGVSK